ncbi:NfrA family protein [Enterovibrio coralii]|uniref:Bacteriophage N4 adsorption protein A C-terminal domain-containing protein n=1 Tax=Enterovibrio coralii TaxID=294935 RepID=A0A135I9E6_9GAMM|nr:hypothetical protein [Enterovibrio coralii]KXF82075.1 hypothetical protein ATN88_19925 [Enterovibrio coralii]
MKYSKTAIAALLVSVNAHATSEIMQGLSEFDEFRTYPYINKAYQLEREKQFSAAEDEVEKALHVAPEHLPFQRFQYSLLTKAGDYSEAARVLQNIPKDEREGMLLSLRQQQISKAGVLTQAELTPLLKGLTLEEQQKLVLSYLYHLEKIDGEDEALAWAMSLPTKLKSLDVLTFEAETAFELKRYDHVTDTLSKVATQQDLPEHQTALLGLSYLAKADVDSALAIANASPKAKSSEAIVRQHIENLVNDNNVAEAREQYAWLAEHHPLSDADYKKSFELAIKDKDFEKALDYSEMAGVDCLSTADLYLKLDQRAKAKSTLAGCNVSENPKNWLFLAEKINMVSAIESQRFKSPEAASLRRSILANLYNRKHQYQKQIALLKGTRQLKEIKLLAIAYQRTKAYPEAIDTWYQLFLRTGDTEALNTASTLAIEHLGAQKAIRLVRDSLPKLRSEKEREIQLDRLLNLYYHHPEYFVASDITMFKGHDISSLALAELWAKYDACDVVTKNITHPTTSFEYRVLGFCIYEDEPERGLAYLNKAHALKPSELDTLYYGYIYSYLGQQEKALSYWLLIPENQQTPNIKLQIGRTYYALGGYDNAEKYWKAAKLEDNLNWWLLGIDTAIRLHHFEAARLRLDTASTLFHSEYLDAEYPILYKTLGDTKSLIAFYESEIQQHPEMGIVKAELAYTLFEQDPKRAVSLLEQAMPDLNAEQKVQAERQLALGYSRLGESSKAKDMYVKAIDHLDDKDSPETLHYLQSGFKTADHDWQFSLSSTLGNDTRNASSALRPENQSWFLLAEASKDILRHSNGEKSLTFKLAWLSSGESDPFDQREYDIGLSWRPFEQTDFNLAMGFRQTVKGGFESDAYIRAYGDVLAGFDYGKGWRVNSDYWWYQSLYLDAFKYLDENQTLLFGRYEGGPVFPWIEQNQQRLRAYGFVQHDQDMDDDNPDDTHRKDLRAGLGVGWLSAWDYNKYSGYNHDVEIDLEWQHIIDSDYYPNSNKDNAFMLRFYWHY